MLGKELQTGFAVRILLPTSQQPSQLDLQRDQPSLQLLTAELAGAEPMPEQRAR
jgi:hypothetical protein